MACMVIDMRIGIAGASGYTGAELLRLCAGHPNLDVVWAGAGTQAGSHVGELYPSLGPAYPSLRLDELDPAALDGLDLAFLALPHGEAQQLVSDIRKGVGVVVDLSADFRLRDPAAYPRWYGAEHAAPELLPTFSYGLPELFRSDLVGADLVAAPGCYVTAAALALAPFVRAGAIDPVGVIVDAASGVSGAGRRLAHTTQFGTANEDFSAYGLLDHRHTPEIEQATGAQVLFTPHLAPMTRGILATCYARPMGPTETDDLLALLGTTYRDEPFVSVSEAPPSTKATLGSNAAHLTARFDPRTGWVVVLCALDNLVKGASGQAVQCANLALGLPETSGLSTVGVYP
ncbi:MAG TPA: N-acetyl-gamma-glutamyl-phosphate reductase [Acidimicrobiales bacterium]